MIKIWNKHGRCPNLPDVRRYLSLPYITIKLRKIESETFSIYDFLSFFMYFFALYLLVCSFCCCFSRFCTYLISSYESGIRLCIKCTRWTMFSSTLETPVEKPRKIMNAYATKYKWKDMANRTPCHIYSLKFSHLQCLNTFSHPHPTPWKITSD